MPSGKPTFNIRQEKEKQAKSQEIQVDLKKATEVVGNEYQPVIPKTPTERKLANLRPFQNQLEPKQRLDVNEDLLIATFSAESPYIWCKDKRSLKGRPMDFVGEKLTQKRPFLIQPLDDTSVYKGYQKARQVGVSEISVTEALWFMDTKKHTKVCYTLPSGRQVQDFSNTRVVPAIDESEYLKLNKGEIQNVNLKQIGDSFLFLRSGATERLGEGIDADVTFFDELDRMSPRIKVAFEESLGGSSFGWMRDISTPSVPNFGVNIGWEKSKQYFWYIKCSHCGTRQQLTWLPDEEFNSKSSIAVNLVGVHIYACKHCDRELRESDRFDGEYVAKYPTREPSFYQMSQLMAPWISAEQLFRKQDDYPFKQLFFNYCLGMPYLGDNILVTESMIVNALSTDMRITYPLWETPIAQRVAIGVDWGDKSYAVVGVPIKGKIAIIDLMEIDDPDPDQHPIQVSKLIQKYDADIIVCDAGYGRDRNAKLLKWHPEKIFSCFYPSMERGSKIFEPQWQEEASKVSIDRTNSLKLSLGYFRSKDIIVARNLDQKLLEKFTKHCVNLVSVKDIDDKSGEVSEIIANMGADHYGHAMNYMVTAMAKLNDLPKSSFWNGDKEITSIQNENKKKVSVGGLAQVPGIVDSENLLHRSALKGILKGICYGTKFDKESEKCYNCAQSRSCRGMCE